MIKEVKGYVRLEENLRFEVGDRVTHISPFKGFSGEVIEIIGDRLDTIERLSKGHRPNPFRYKILKEDGKAYEGYYYEFEYDVQRNREININDVLNS